MADVLPPVSPPVDRHDAVTALPPLRQVALALDAVPMPGLAANAAEGAAGPWTLRLSRIAEPENECVRSRQCDLWAFVWGSTAVLGSILLGLPAPSITKCTVLEIGAGTGVASLCAAHRGATVLTTDLVEDALTLCRHNAAANGIQAAAAAADVASSIAPQLTTHLLDWHRPAFPATAAHPASGTVGRNCGRFDLIVGSDVLYMGRAAKPIAALCAECLAPGQAALFVDPGRPNTEAFVDAAEALQLHVERADVWRLRTAVCDMAKCTLLLVTAPGATTTSVWTRAWLDATAAALSDQWGVADADPFAAQYRM